jgi:hypothetical protein
VSTNYFNVPTYRPPTQFQPPAVNFNVPTMPTVPGNMDPSGQGMAKAPNYAARNLLLGQLGSGGSISTRYKGLMQARRDAAKAQTRGYGGINWREDDLSTLEDESLTPSYESDKMGQNERDAYNAALSRGAASGISYSTAGDQLVGAALQRVSDEAAKTISQYAGDINSYATSQLSESSTALTNYMSLYGSDATWTLSQNVPATTPPPDPNTAPPDRVVSRGGTVGANNPFLAGKTVYSGKRRPDLSAYRSRFNSGRNYRVIATPPARPGGNWTVVVRYYPNGVMTASDVDRRGFATLSGASTA